jgi:hypothetical protein
MCYLYDSKMKKVAIVVIAILIALAASAYFYLSDKEDIVRLSGTEIQTRLEAKSPLTKTYFFYSGNA